MSAERLTIKTALNDFATLKLSLDKLAEVPMSWGCPFDAGGACQRVSGQRCDPGMQGCILYGRVTFSVAEKNTPSIRRGRSPKRRTKHTQPTRRPTRS